MVRQEYDWKRKEQRKKRKKKKRKFPLENTNRTNKRTRESVR